MDGPFDKIAVAGEPFKLGKRYSCAQNKPIGSHIMKQNADFKEGISQP